MKISTHNPSPKHRFPILSLIGAIMIAQNISSAAVDRSCVGQISSSMEISPAIATMLGTFGDLELKGLPSLGSLSELSKRYPALMEQFSKGIVDRFSPLLANPNYRISPETRALMNSGMAFLEALANGRSKALQSTDDLDGQVLEAIVTRLRAGVNIRTADQRELIEIMNNIIKESGTDMNLNRGINAQFKSRTEKEAFIAKCKRT